MSPQQQLRKFLADNGSYFGPDPETVAEDFPLIDSGALDSLGIFELVAFLEKEFSFKIGVEDMTRGSFGSLADIEKFIQFKSAGIR